MVDAVEKALGISGVVSGALSFLFYRYYINRTNTAQNVQGIPVWESDLELFDHLSAVDEHCLAYAAVEGVVTDLGRTLTSQHGDEVGVMRQSQLVEHRSKRVNGFWSDTKKEIRDNMQTVPFALTKSDGDPKFNVEVTEPGEAYHLKDDLDVTYDRFEPHKSSLVEMGMDRLFGEMAKGVQETERMLVTGTSLLGVGKVFLEKGRIRMGPPSDPSRSYILTTMSLSQLVKSYQSQSNTFKILSLVFATLGGTLLAYLLWRRTRKWVERRRQRREFETIRRALRDNARESTSGDRGDLHDSEACVVCLASPRQVVALNCGHIALCANCAELLPSPKLCPVCRASVARFAPVFLP